MAGLGLFVASVWAAEPAPLTHAATERKSAVNLRVASLLKIVLPERGQPNHAWQIASNDPRVLRALGPLKPARDVKAGTPVAWEITFRAQRPGRDTLRFVYAKTGTTDTAAPDEVREVAVRVESAF